MNLRRFLSPGWILGIVLVILFSVACFSFLAPWQLGKNDQLNARNDRLTESTEAAPIPLAEAVAAADPQALEWHLVTARGHFDPDPQREVLLRLRPFDGQMAYQMLVPFRTDDGTTVLVNRGWVPVGDAGAVPEYEPVPSGEVTITGRWRMPETGALEPTEIDGRQTVKTFDTAAIGALPEMGQMELVPQYLALSPEQPGTLTPIPTPAIETGPYLSYGMQWIAFGIFAPLAVIYFVTSEIRNRRAAARFTAATSTATGGAGADPASPAVDAARETGSAAEPADASAAAIAPAAAGTRALAASRDSSAGRGEPGDAPEAGPDDEATRRAAMLSSRYGDKYNAAEFRRGRRGRSRF